MIEDILMEIRRAVIEDHAKALAQITQPKGSTPMNHFNNPVNLKNMLSEIANMRTELMVVRHQATNVISRLDAMAAHIRDCSGYAKPMSGQDIYGQQTPPPPTPIFYDDRNDSLAGVVSNAGPYPGYGQYVQPPMWQSPHDPRSPGFGSFNDQHIRPIDYANFCPQLPSGEAILADPTHLTTTTGMAIKLSYDNISSLTSDYLIDIQDVNFLSSFEIPPNDIHTLEIPLYADYARGRPSIADAILVLYSATRNPATVSLSIKYDDNHLVIQTSTKLRVFDHYMAANSFYELLCRNKNIPCVSKHLVARYRLVRCGNVNFDPEDVVLADNYMNNGMCYTDGIWKTTFVYKFSDIEPETPTLDGYIGGMIRNVESSNNA